jgi:hypothetical protein
MGIRRRTRRTRHWYRRNQYNRWFQLGRAFMVAAAAVTALILVIDAFQHA